MPGAGTGKSCDACRHRKKKCDEKRPTCSRCEKLGIECVGVGQTRFKFRYAVSSNTNPGSFKRGAWSRNGHQLIKLSPPPTNDASCISNAFASLLSITDPGSSILSFGSMFAEVPMRMEQSPVLTAAAKTLTSSASAFYSGGSSLQAFTHYGKALTVLRADVASAVDNAHFSHTMCAIAILCLSHNLLHGQRAELEVHIRGLLYLLAKMPDVEPKTEFEKQAVSLAWSLVIGESIMDPTIELDPRVVAKQKRRLGPVATASASFTTEFYSLRWENLINLPAQLQDPMSYDMEIRATYEDMTSESPRIITLAAQLFDAVQKTRIQKLAFQYILCETGNVEMLSMSLVLNSVLQILDVADGQKLVLECTNLIEETMKASERLDRFRPLGTARLPNALCLCWLLAPTPRLRETMREVLQEHIQDFRGVTWQDLAGRYDTRFRHMRAQVRRRLSPLSIT